MQILPGSSDDERFINASGRFCNIARGRTAPASCAIKSRRWRARRSRKSPRPSNSCAKLAVALKPAERYGFGISGRQGSAIFISFTPWLCPSGGGTVNFDTDEVLINNPAPGEADLRRVRSVAARRSARVRSVPEVSETGAGRRRRRLATCDWRRGRLM
jgi:hypothetical protein